MGRETAVAFADVVRMFFMNTGWYRLIAAGQFGLDGTHAELIWRAGTDIEKRITPPPVTAAERS
jgi:hypothetical protein